MAYFLLCLFIYLSIVCQTLIFTFEFYLNSESESNINNLLPEIAFQVSFDILILRDSLAVSVACCLLWTSSSVSWNELDYLDWNLETTLHGLRKAFLICLVLWLANLTVLIIYNENCQLFLNPLLLEPLLSSDQTSNEFIFIWKTWGEG